MSYELREFPVESFPRLTHFGYCSSSKNLSFHTHRHLGHEFVYVESGGADVSMITGSQPLRLRVHDCVLTPPTMDHRFCVESGEMSFYWVGIQTEDVVQTSDSNILPPKALLERRAVRVQLLGPDRRYGDLGRLAESLVLEAATTLRRMPEIGAVMRAMERELTCPEGADPYLVYIKALELFALYRKRLFGPRPNRNPSFLVRSVAAHIATSFAQNISNPDLATYAGVSVRQLHRLFRSELGITPAGLVERMRIEEACRLLCEGWRPVDVPRRVGFSSAEHFYRRFRRAMGMTPKEYSQKAPN